MDILHQIPTETKIKRELKRVLFGKKLYCPRCGSKTIKKYKDRYRCRVCRKPFSLKSVCWLKGAKLPLRTIWLLIWCWCNKVPIDQTRKVCGLSEPTARKWYEKFRLHLPQEKLSEIRLSGIVQMDEFYRGGKKEGYSIIGAKEQSKPKKRRKIALEVLPKPSVDRKDALDFLSQNVEPHSQLQTDGYAIYKGIGNWWPVKHLFELHKHWEFALTSEIEGLWGNFITFVRRMYHHVSKEKLPGILQEFAARQVYPEWFQSPYSFLNIAFKPIPCINRKPGRPKKEISFIQVSSFSMPDLLNQLTSVPS
jgi:transposase-like protein